MFSNMFFAVFDSQYFIKHFIPITQNRYTILTNSRYHFHKILLNSTKFVYGRKHF